jgi:hypothetical protein
MALVTLLSLLAAGAVVLALFQAPSTPNLVVHNGVGELTLGRQVTIHARAPGSATTQTGDFQAPDRATVVTRDGPVVVQRQTAHGTNATAIFGPFRFLLRVNTFTPVRGGRFVANVPASQVVSAAEAPSVRGGVHFTATVRNGLLIGLQEVIALRSPAGSENGIIIYCVSRFNNTVVQAC